MPPLKAYSKAAAAAAAAAKVARKLNIRHSQSESLSDQNGIGGGGWHSPL